MSDTETEMASEVEDAHIDDECEAYEEEGDELLEDAAEAALAPAGEAPAEDPEPALETPDAELRHAKQHLKTMLDVQMIQMEARSSKSHAMSEKEFTPELVADALSKLQAKVSRLSPGLPCRLAYGNVLEVSDLVDTLLETLVDPSVVNGRSQLSEFISTSRAVAELDGPVFVEQARTLRGFERFLLACKDDRDKSR